MPKATTIKERVAPLNTQHTLLNKLISDTPSEMQPEYTQQHASIYFAIGAALLFHILLLIVLSYLPAINDTEQLRTVPTVTVSAGSRASINSQQNRVESANTAAANAYLATLEASSFKVQRAQSNTKGAQRNATRKPQHSPLKQTEMPPTKSPQSQAQTIRAQQANEGMMNIFKQMKLTGETEQISTTKHKELSNYEISLRSILSRDVLYDQYHQFMAAKGKNNTTESINFEVSITLLANGAIKKAEISQSSGIKEIDALAKRTAYSVSPYPRPPVEDIHKGFKYKIAIAWVPYKK